MDKHYVGFFSIKLGHFIVTAIFCYNKKLELQKSENEDNYASKQVILLNVTIYSIKISKFNQKTDRMSSV